MLGYAMLCCAMLCYARLCYAISSLGRGEKSLDPNAMLCYAMLCSLGYQAGKRSKCMFANMFTLLCVYMLTCLHVNIARLISRHPIFTPRSLPHGFPRQMGHTNRDTREYPEGPGPQKCQFRHTLICPPDIPAPRFFTA